MAIKAVENTRIVASPCYEVQLTFQGSPENVGRVRASRNAQSPPTGATAHDEWIRGKPARPMTSGEGPHSFTFSWSASDMTGPVSPSKIMPCATNETPALDCSITKSGFFLFIEVIQK